jgi:NADH-quinone oxidoreductase subunit L
MVVFITLALAALLTAFYTARQITLVFLGKPRTKSAEHAQESVPSMTVPLLILAFFAVTLGWIGIPHTFPVLGKISSAPLQSFLGSMLSFEGGEEGHSLIPLFTSLLVSLGGLLIGWLVYRKVSSTKTKDPVAQVLPGPFSFLQHKYYLDEVYEFLFIHPSLWFAENVVYKFIDKKVIDGTLHGIAALGLKLGNLFRFGFDLPVINKAGDELAEGTHGLGKLLRHLQSGRVQQYLTIGIACMVVAGVVILTFVVAK